MVDGGENFGGEVESSGGGGDGTLFAGEDGLVAVVIGDIALAVHVVRQGEVAVGVLVDFTIPEDDTVAVCEYGFDGAGCGADL